MECRSLGVSRDQSKEVLSPLGHAGLVGHDQRLAEGQEDDDGAQDAGLLPEARLANRMARQRAAMYIENADQLF